MLGDGVLPLALDAGFRDGLDFSPDFVILASGDGAF